MSDLVIEVPPGYDFWRSTRAVGPVATHLDRATMLWATTTPEGPGTLRLQLTEPGRVVADAWGDGTSWMLRQAPLVLGLADDPAAFRPVDGVVADLVRHRPGVHLARTDRVYEALFAAILGQKVQTASAFASLQALARRFGAPAPGPGALRLLPSAAVVASLDYSAFHPCNVERARAERLLNVARRARWVEQQGSATDLQRLVGVGPWTAATAAAGAWGDADAVPVGDFHLPNTVAWALAREPRADDARMLELLEPYRPHRGRVVRLLGEAHAAAPRRGPRLAISDIRRR